MCQGCDHAVPIILPLAHRGIGMDSPAMAVDEAAGAAQQVHTGPVTDDGPITEPVTADGAVDMMETDGASAAQQSTVPSSSGHGPPDAARSSKLARKAESARQARLRHKQYVGELQEHVAVLQKRCRTLEAQCTEEASAAHVAQQLKQMLQPEQHSRLVEWLQAVQGDGHVLQRHTMPPTLPPTPNFAPSSLPPTPGSGPVNGGSASGSKPIAINRAASLGDMEDETLGLSRSWEDIEGARSILNLNFPHGFLSFSLPAWPQQSPAVPSFSLGAPPIGAPAPQGLSYGANLSRSRPATALKGFAPSSSAAAGGLSGPSASCAPGGSAGLTFCGMLSPPQQPGTAAAAGAFAAAPLLQPTVEPASGASEAANCAGGKQAELEASMQSERAGTLGVGGAPGLLAEAYSLAEPLALGST